MKRCFYFVISLVFSLLALACSNITEDAYVFENASSGKSLVYLNVSTRKGTRFFFSRQDYSSDGARTILPNAVDGSTLNYYLFYIDTLSSSTSEYSYYGKVSLTYTSETTATSAVSFSDSVYRFVLYACSSSLSSPSALTAKNAACLAAYTIADLRTVKDVSFYLSSNSLEGNGYANISLTSSWSFPSDWNVSFNGNSYVTIGIYDISTGLPVSINDSNINPHSLVYSYEISNNLHLSNYRFGNYRFPAGSYSLIVSFVNENTGTVYEYNDVIHIFPNQTSSAIIDVPNILDTRPAAPSNFTVTPLIPDDDQQTNYLAGFTWVDNANNETEFEIQIADISDNLSNLNGTAQIYNVIDDASWSSAVFNSPVTTFSNENYHEYISYYYAYFENDDYDPNSFSLLRNNSQAKFYLQLGKRYLARIRAVNDCGKSNWSYASFADGSCTSINLYRITYTTNTGSTSVYRSQLSSGVTIESSDVADWQAWYISEISYDSSGNATNTNKYPMSGTDCDAYTGHSNLDLIGFYGTIPDDITYRWYDNDVILYGWDSAFNDVYFDALTAVDGSPNKTRCENEQYLEISKAQVSTLNWALSPSVPEIDAAAAINRYDSVRYSLVRRSTLGLVASGEIDLSINSLRTNVASLKNDHYIMNFTGTKDSKQYHFIVIFKLSD